MEIAALLDYLGEAETAALFGLLTGGIFGVSAQKSAFCLRAATVEFARGKLGRKVAVWLLTFSTALIWVYLAELFELFNPADARIIAITGSWSGAIIGGLMFGAGMVMARGCSGRLLVLAATGNLRSVVSGLVFAVTAQMALRGWLAPLRQWLAGLWTTPAGQNVNLLALINMPPWFGPLMGFAAAGLALYISAKEKIGWKTLFFASGVGFSVAVGWVLTWSLSTTAFDPVNVTSLTFSGPSASTLMFFLTNDRVLNFEIGLVPGAFGGALIAAAFSRELKFQGFDGESQMRRSLTGAVLMGFGAMLAGGCAIGAGVTGTSVFAATAWLALFFMWVGAVTTDWLIDRPKSLEGAAQAPA